MTSSKFEQIKKLAPQNIEIFETGKETQKLNLNEWSLPRREGIMMQENQYSGQF